MSLSCIPQDVARGLPVLSRSLGKMGIATWRLRSLAKQLNGVLAETRGRLMNLLPPRSNATAEHIASALNCSDVATCTSTTGVIGNATSLDEQRTTDLTNAWKLLTSLTMNTNYADNEAVTKAKLMADFATRMNFKGLVDNAMAAYEALMANLREITEERVRRLKDSLDVTEDNVTKSFLWLNQTVMTVRDVDLSIVDYEHYIDTFQHYYKYTCIVLTSVLLLLVVGNFFAIFLPFCKQRKVQWKVQSGVQPEVPLKKDFRRRQATNILTYGAACTRSLGCFFALALVVLFAFGSATYIVVCRPCITRDATFERYVDLTKQEANVTYNVTLAGVLRRCRDNESVYMAFDVEHSTQFNLSEILNLRDVYEAVEQLEYVFIGFDDFQVFTSTVWTIGRAIAKEFESVDFVAYLNTSRSNVTKVSLTQYASLLDNVCADMPDLALANKLSREAKHLRDMEAKYVRTMQLYHSMLRKAVTTSHHVLRIPLSKLMFEIISSQRAINKHGDEVVRSAIADVSADVLRAAERFVDNVNGSVRDDIGRCRPLYDAWVAMVTSPCLNLVAPFNVVWASYGVFLCLCFPALKLAQCLAAML
ncbi:hypothetical protein LSAT2_032498 [Lamellibrachia satsuma]|nr:hypothetical protein LSAT2_032498 [Lamellibrachia satsuma]